MREILSYSFVLPPTIFIVVCLIGALISLASARVGTKVVLVSSIFLYLLAMPAVSTFLFDELGMLVPANVDLARAQAIVVLGGDVKYGNGVGVPNSVGLLTLDRLAEAARLYRRLQLPILVSGGPVARSGPSLASLMQEVLEIDFHIPVKWTETKSRTTFENAVFTSQILRAENIDAAIIVTQPWHMPRALWSFNRVGFHALPFSNQATSQSLEIQDFFPSARAFHDSFYAFHEIIGLGYYKFFH